MATRMDDVVELFEVEELEERFEMKWIEIGGGGNPPANPDCQIPRGGGPINPACPPGTE